MNWNTFNFIITEQNRTVFPCEFFFHLFLLWKKKQNLLKSEAFVFHTIILLFEIHFSLFINSFNYLFLLKNCGNPKRLFFKKHSLINKLPQFCFKLTNLTREKTKENLKKSYAINIVLLQFFFLKKFISLFAFSFKFCFPFSINYKIFLIYRKIILVFFFFY